MPDPTRQSVSASQMPALFNLSPYDTALSIYHQLKDGTERSTRAPDLRMRIGKALQPALLQIAAEELRLEVQPNPADTYHRHPSLPVGHTADARIYDPQRGPGVLELKCVAWDQMSAWMGERSPAHVELQLQAAMLAEGAQWGCIAAFLGGGMFRFFQREPVAHWQEAMAEAARDLFARIAEGVPPPASGLPVEADLFKQLYPEVTRNTKESDDPELDDDAATWIRQGEVEKLAGEARASARVRLLHALGDAEALFLRNHVAAQRRDKRGAVTLTVTPRKA